MRELILMLCLSICLTCAALVSAQEPAAEPVTIHEAANIPADLSGWEFDENTTYAVDDTVMYEGFNSLKIQVAPEVELHWQKGKMEFGNVKVADEYAISVWVKTEGITDGSGAYAAMEFIDANENRVGLYHSKLGIDNGARGWEQLIIEGSAPDTAVKVWLSVILNSHATAWFSAPTLTLTKCVPEYPDMGDATRTINVKSEEVISANFTGVGFHAFHQTFKWTDEEMNQVIIKCWRELAPAFVRMNDNYKWELRDQAARHMAYMQGDTGTQIYVATWDPPVIDINDDAGFAEYASNVVDQLEYWKKTKGIQNLKYYCMSNELSLGGWGKMAQNMDLFKRYHQAIYNELQKRGLDIKLLASDASPIEWWWTIDWATKNMNDITGVYGGHHYINDRPLSDERFYGWFLEKMKWGADMARSVGKDFILGEFGAKQDGTQVRGKTNDACIYNDTPQERFVAIQLAEAAFAAINGGVNAMGYWTFMDCPDNWISTYRNKWGLFKCDEGDFQTRDYYYGFGLLSKFLRGPATVYEVETNDPRLRAVAIKNNFNQAWTIAVVNRNQAGVRLNLQVDGIAVNGRFRKYVYDPMNVPQNEFGDLQRPADVVAMDDGKLADILTGGTLNLYTTAYDDEAPAQVTGVVALQTGDGMSVSWDENLENDFCYYRVYRSNRLPVPINTNTQIASTVVANYIDKAGHPASYYAVVAVDKSGNAAEAGMPGMTKRW